MTATHKGSVTFPTLDAEDTPLAVIRAEALEAWRRGLAASGFVQVGHATVEIKHTERATVTVHGAARAVRSILDVPVTVVAA